MTSYLVAVFQRYFVRIFVFFSLQVKLKSGEDDVINGHYFSFRLSLMPCKRMKVSGIRYTPLVKKTTTFYRTLEQPLGCQAIAKSQIEFEFNVFQVRVCRGEMLIKPVEFLLISFYTEVHADATKIFETACNNVISKVRKFDLHCSL